MSEPLSDVDQAEKLSRRRAFMAPVLAMIFLTQQMSFFLSENERGSELVRSVDRVKLSAWLVLSLVLLAFLWSGGGWLRGKAVRALMNDEITRANRASALTLGFFVAMLMAIALYLLDMIDPMSSRLAIHMVVTLGIGAALIRFGLLERRAHRDG